MRKDGPESTTEWVARRALIVDDEHVARKALAWLFTDAGMEVTSAASGEEALAMLGVERYDLLLTDVRMPGIDGVDLMRRALVLDPDLSVVVMTAHAEVAAAVQAMSEGAFWYVNKPVDLDALLDVVGRAFELRALRESAASHTAHPAGASAAHSANEAPPNVPGATLDAVERHAIVATVRAAHGDLAAAAQVLGVSAPFLAARLRRYGGTS